MRMAQEAAHYGKLKSQILLVNFSTDIYVRAHCLRGLFPRMGRQLQREAGNDSEDSVLEPALLR